MNFSQFLFKKLDSSYIYGLILLNLLFVMSFCCGAAVTDISQEFFGRIDLERPELSDVKNAYLSGNHTLALNKYRDIFVDRMAALDLGSADGFWSQGATSTSMAYAGTIKMDAMGTGYCTYTIGLPENVQWFPLVDCYIDFGRDVSSMHWTGIIIKGYLAGQSTYLTRFCDYWDDFAANWMDSRPANGYPYSDTLHWAWKSGLYLAWRVDNFMRFYAAACKYSPTQAKVSITGAKLANILNQLATLEIPDLAGYRYPTTPNQQVLAIQALLKASAALEDFKNVDSWRSFALSKAEEYVTAGSYLADGSDQEQSFNYNAGLIGSAQQMINLITGIMPDDQQALEITAKLAQAKIYRSRFLEMLKSPIGSTPATGTSSMTVPVSYTSNIYENFTSIYYPYGGYAMLRSAWDSHALYTFFKSSRIGYGHYVEDGLHLTLCAYGKNLLIAGGPNSYSGEDIDEYYRSSFSRNTIAVDGFGQTSRQGNTMPAAGYPEPIDAIWHTSENFDLAQGVYNYGYGDKITDVTHERDVLHLRKIRAFVAIDRLRAEQAHDYTLTWGFDPAFAAGQVLYEPGQMKLYTNKSGHPNLTIQHFTSADLSAQMYYGESGVVGSNIHDVGWLGWYTPVSGHDNNIPKVDAHLNWSGSGSQQIVSLLFPQSDSGSMADTVLSYDNGFDLTLTTGEKIACRAALAAQVMAVNQVSAKSEMLIVQEVENQPLRGLVLGAVDKSLQVNGRLFNTKYEDFEFSYSAGRFNSVPIQKPDYFIWKGDAVEMYPEYNDPASLDLPCWGQGSGNYLTGDLDCDSKVDILDFYLLAESWLIRQAAISIDINSDGIIDIHDFSMVAGNWKNVLPVLWWAISEDDTDYIHDFGTASLKGQISGSPLWSGDSPVSSRAMIFDGVDDHVTNSLFDSISPASARTISVWIKTQSCGSIVSWGDDSPEGQAFSLTVQDQYGLPGTLAVLAGSGYKVGKTDLRDNRWHNVAVVLPDDGSPDIWEAKLYVDGIEEKYSSFRGNPVNTSPGPLSLGADIHGENHFEGIIDELKIYNKVQVPALSD
jgi:hypothetical protein